MAVTPQQHSFCTKNQSWTYLHAVQPAHQLNETLGHFVHVVTTPLDALELVGRVAIGMLVFPLCCIKTTPYLKEFIYTPLVEIGNIVKGLTTELIKLAGEVTIYAIGIIGFIATGFFCCMCCGTIDFNNNQPPGGGGGAPFPPHTPPGPPPRPDDDDDHCDGGISQSRTNTTAIISAASLDSSSSSSTDDN